MSLMHERLSSTATGVSALEQPLMVGKSHAALTIGVPCERGFQENRVALSPHAVRRLVNNGHTILVETGAGAASYYTDHAYSEAGAQITSNCAEVYKAPVILKVGPVPPKELQYLTGGQFLFGALHLPTMQEDYLKELLKKRIVGVAYEYLRDRSDALPVVRSMSEIAGSCCILIAAEYLSHSSEGVGKLLGGITGIPPSRVVILGAGTVGEYAARTALGLGSEVRLFDHSVSRLRRLQNNLGQRVYTSLVEPTTLAMELKLADVAVGAIHAPLGRTPLLVSEEMVQSMRPGSVIIDVSIDQGGCFETSEITNHTHPVFRKYGVTHYCVPNIPSRVSNTASEALSSIMSGVLLDSGEHGGLETHLWLDRGLRAGVYCYHGQLTNKYLSEVFGIGYTNLDLVASSRM